MITGEVQNPFIQGDLSLFPLYDVLQLLAQVQAAVCVDLLAGDSGERIGRIWIDGPKVMAAMADGAAPGEPAFYHLFSLERGRFVGGESVPLPLPTREEGLGDLYNLLIDVAHQRAQDLGQGPPEVRRTGSFLLIREGLAS